MSRPRILVATPIGVRTGGPEACYQLAAMASELGWEAALLPINGYEGNVPEPEYGRYGCEIVGRLPPGSEAHVVVPELWPTAALRIGRHRTTMWWLSVDYSPLRSARRWVQRTQPDLHINGERSSGRGKGQIPLGRRPRHLASRTRLSAADFTMRRRSFLHAAQSYYALRFCSEVLNTRPVLMSDYLRPIDVPMTWRGGNGVVWFNGAKGREVIQELAKLAPDVVFKAIAGMSYDEVLDSLIQGSLYLEAGHLPGRDRLPREAARLGLPVIVLERGAGMKSGDFPHLENFRIPIAQGWKAEVIAKLRSTLHDPVAASAAQRKFQEWVGADRSRFRSEVSAWLDRVERLHE